MKRDRAPAGRPIRFYASRSAQCDRLSLAICSAIAWKAIFSVTPSSALKNLSGLEAHCCSVSIAVLRIELETDRIHGDSLGLHVRAQRARLGVGLPVGRVAVDVRTVRVPGLGAVAVHGVVLAVGHEDRVLHQLVGVVGLGLVGARPQVGPVRRQHVPGPCRADLAGGAASHGRSC